MKNIVTACLVLAACFLIVRTADPADAFGTLELLVDAADLDAMAGRTVHANVNVSALAGKINACQFYVGYDQAVLEPVSVVAGGAPWNLLLYNSWESAPVPGELSAASVVWPTGPVGTDQPGTVARLTFRVRDVSCTAATLHFLPNVDDTKANLLSDLAYGVHVPAAVNSQPIRIGLAGDADGNGLVNIIDLIFIRSRMGQNVNTGNNRQADVTNDGLINILDLVAVRKHLNTRCN